MMSWVCAGQVLSTLCLHATQLLSTHTSLVTDLVVVTVLKHKPAELVELPICNLKKDGLKCMCLCTLDSISFAYWAS